MPRVYVSDSQRNAERIKTISRWAKSKLAENGFGQKDLAEHIHESESQVSRRFSGNNVSLKMILGVIDMCSVQPEEINRVMGRNK